MPWKECHVEDERLRFVARLLDGEKMAPLCREFGISRKTGYKFYDRYRDGGARAFNNRRRRPDRHAKQLPMVVEKWVVQLKREYPTWGAPKIRERLRHRYPDVHCPAISTVHAVLDRHGLVRRRRRRRPHLQGTAPGHPEQNGRHERMHLTLKQAATKPAAANALQQQARFDAFRQRYNHERPHAALNMDVPAAHYAPSSRPYRGLPELEYPLHDWTATVTSAAGSASRNGR